MKGATSRQKPTQRRMEGLGGFARRASGLILPGRAARRLDEAPETKADVRSERTQRSGLKVVSHGVNTSGPVHHLSPAARHARRHENKTRAETRKRRSRYKHGRVGVR